MSLPRFEFELYHCNGGDMSRDDEGTYVEYEGHMTVVADMQKQIDMLTENLAQFEPIARTHVCEISNMEATGLYLRAWPTDRERNAVEGYTVTLYKFNGEVS